MTAMFFACQSENIDCMYDRRRRRLDQPDG